MKKYSFRHTIKQGIAGLFHICKEELKMTVKDQGVLIFPMKLCVKCPWRWSMPTVLP